MALNVWCFTGPLGKDAETKFIKSGEAVVTFSVAVTSGYGDKKATTWARCEMWGKRGESVAPYLLKGQLVGVSGEVTNREYTDKDGNKRTSLDVRVNDLTLLGKKDGAERQPAPQQSAPKSGQAAAYNGDGFSDLDIPFMRIGHGAAWRAI